MKTKKFWHISSVDSCEIVLAEDEDVISSRLDNGNYYGPFDTLTECKKDALEYHRATIAYAQMAISDIKATKLKDLKQD